MTLTATQNPVNVNFTGFLNIFILTGGMAMQKLTTNQFITKAMEIHGTTYDYGTTTYEGAKIKIKITCKVHGLFEQLPHSHLSGQGCPQCARDITNNNKKMPLSEFIARAETKHANKYDYSLVEFINTKTKVKIVCPLHGEFHQIPTLHMKGHGCPSCKNLDTGFTLDEFISRAKAIHGNKYDYKFVVYKNSHTKIDVVCPKHGVFTITPAMHYHRKQGCPQCASRYKSQDLWLDSLGLPNDQSHRQVSITLIDGSKIRADGYDPETKTVYEFWGDYWHGNPKNQPQNKMTHIGVEAGKLYQKTLDKIDAIKSSGYKLVDMWESDWKSV